MSIQFVMRRITPTVYGRCLAESRPQPEFVAVSEGVAADWDVLYRILNGERPGPAAAAVIKGGVRLKHAPDDYGGVRVLSPKDVADASVDLRALDEEEIERRYLAYEFTGAHGAHADGRPDSPVEDYLDAFAELRDFCDATADAGDAMLVLLI